MGIISCGKKKIYKANAIGTDLNRYDIQVTYPQNWFAPIQLSSFSETIEEKTIEWMDAIGLIKNSERLEHIRAMEPRHYAGYTHSMAAYDHALTYCKYITMWLLWDDECVEQANHYEEIDLPLRALAGESMSDTQLLDPYVLAFLHIGDTYESLGATKAWRLRFAQKMSEWAKYAIHEEKMRRFGDNHKPNRSFMEALKIRSFTVGIRPNSIPLERAVGIEIPEYIHTDNHYEMLLDQAAKICCIVNDLVGVPKDIKNNQINSNLVLYHQIYYDCSLRESYDALIEIHDKAVEQYDLLTELLLNKTEKEFKERLSTFFTHLRYMDSGFGYWHRDCVRYQEYVASEDDLYFKLLISCLAPSSEMRNN